MAAALSCAGKARATLLKDSEQHVRALADKQAELDRYDALPREYLQLGLGALAAIFVLIRVISIPDAVLPADGRGIGIWIALIAALGVIAGGLLQAAEEL